MLLIGVVYQYWLATAHLLGRTAAAVGFGQSVGDLMTRGAARLFKMGLGDEANVGGASAR